MSNATATTTTPAAEPAIEANVRERIASNRLAIVREILGACDDPYQTEASAAESAMSRVRGLTAEVERLRSDRDEYARVALVGLSGLIPTPEKGYVEDGGPGLLMADMRRMRDEVKRLTKLVEFYRDACTKGEDEVQQILGRALGYPRYADDAISFPSCHPDDPSVATGDHVAASLAMEAAERIGKLQAEVETLRAPAPRDVALPEPDAYGNYRLANGDVILAASYTVAGERHPCWHAYPGGGDPLCNCDPGRGGVYRMAISFSTPEDAAAALAEHRRNGEAPDA